MNPAFCNVALPVPPRTTFTYAIPEALRGTLQPGSRVLVPFRKKAMVGVVVEFVESGPEGTKIREMTRAMDLVPALTPKLLELAQWIAGYYLGPIGEVFRAMLPPLTEIKTQRLIALTEAGRKFVERSNGSEATVALTLFESAFLAKLGKSKGALPFAGSKIGLDAAALQKLQRHGLLEIREI